MPLTIPALDNRRYQDLLDEALARVPVHNPEWTNFNKSDPGVTIIELFAFLTETLLYRANQIPERNRRKFLTLLGIPLAPAASARGIVTISNDRGPLETVTLNEGQEVRAGQVPFRTEKTLDVLPIEGQVYFKRRLTAAEATDQRKAYYKQLYTSFMGQPAQKEPVLYETTPLAAPGVNGVNLGDTVDNCLWLALLARAADKPYDGAVAQARTALAGKTLNLGIAPLVEKSGRQLLPNQAAGTPSLLLYEMPKLPDGGLLPASRQPQYQTLTPGSEDNVLNEPGIVQITLPAETDLHLWSNLDPLEAGVDQFPPALEDTALNDRLITWVRIRSTAATAPKFLWVGINAVFVTQRAHVANEILPDGSGEPDQVVTLAKTPVLPGSVRLRVTYQGIITPWDEIDDLLAAGAEAASPDLRQPPGVPVTANPRLDVFTLDPEAGLLRFGDGAHGRRPPAGAVLRADYDYGQGAQGNVSVGAINSGPALPAGFKVANPLRTWGGAEAESESEGEKQVARYLQHRDRLVNAADFETITLRTPGVDIGRVEVLSAFNPDLRTPSSTNEPGDAPGAVTLLVIPRYDAANPDAPQPDGVFLNTICAYLDPRRLVTTELYLRGPFYKPIWVSVGIDVVAGFSVAAVREAVKQALKQFLSPLPPAGAQPALAGELSLTTPQYAQAQGGWPLRKPVVDMELLAVASRVPGVAYVNRVLVAEGNGPATTTPIVMAGLNLPQVMRIDVAVGDPASIDQLRGQTSDLPLPAGGSFVPVPVIPEQCR